MFLKFFIVTMYLQHKSDRPPAWPAKGPNKQQKHRTSKLNFDTRHSFLQSQYSTFTVKNTHIHSSKFPIILDSAWLLEVQKSNISWHWSWGVQRWRTCRFSDFIIILYSDSVKIHFLFYVSYIVITELPKKIRRLWLFQGLEHLLVTGRSWVQIQIVHLSCQVCDVKLKKDYFV